MLTCKKVSRTLAESDYESLPPLKKLGLRIHVALCVVCGKFNRQVMLMQDTCRSFKQHEEEILERRPGMDEAHKSQLRAAITEETTGHG